MQALIERLSERAHDPRRATDEGQGQSGDTAPADVAAPATELQVGGAERALGFPLPELLRRLYLEVGNGGFGPGHGLWGVPMSDKAESLVSQYEARRRGQKSPAWPEGLLPLCDWGSGIMSCVDCTLPANPIVRVDANMPRADVAGRVPAAMHYDRAGRVIQACWVENPSLLQWLEGWADGINLFFAAYGSGDSNEDEDEDDETEQPDL